MVVGPSGAGKDTLIEIVREACAGDPEVVFPRRIVTREATAHEANDMLSVEAFQAAQERDAFALAWEAHGLRYGLPCAIIDDVAAGRTVVVNASRTVIVAARRRFSQVVAVLVTAPADVLAARLAVRGRATDGELGARLRRATVAADGTVDVVIDNIGEPARHGRELLAVVRGSPSAPG